MNNTQSVTIVLLLVTAAMLTGLLVATWVHTDTAYAGNGAIRAGDYVMVPGEYNQETEMIYIIDISNNKLNVYYPNINTNSLTLADTVDLARAFRAGAP